MRNLAREERRHRGPTSSHNLTLTTLQTLQTLQGPAMTKSLQSIVRVSTQYNKSIIVQYFVSKFFLNNAMIGDIGGVEGFL